MKTESWQETEAFCCSCYPHLTLFFTERGRCRLSEADKNMNPYLLLTCCLCSHTWTLWGQFMFFLHWIIKKKKILFSSVQSQVALTNILAAGFDSLISSLLPACSDWRTQTCGEGTILCLTGFHFLCRNNICFECHVPKRAIPFTHHWFSHHLNFKDQSLEQTVVIDIS